jgi:NhaA family Na+:H+ antiporter
LPTFLRVEEAGGLLLLVATVAALVWANAAPGSYTGFWGHHLVVSVGGRERGTSLVHVVDDGLMVLFFFVVGLEIEREWAVGELRDRRAALLPAVAALAGMVVPALLFVAVTAGAGSGAGRGWGIPMATDIAFALGVLAVLGSRVPPPLKVFLLTLAIVDDIGAIVVIAVFYSEGLVPAWLGIAATLVVVLLVLRRVGVRSPVPYLGVGVLLWAATAASGIHPTIAGVVVALLLPSGSRRAAVDRADDGDHAGEQAAAGDGGDDGNAARGGDREGAAAVDGVRRTRERLEARLHPWTGLVVVPLFALANAGIDLGGGLSGDGRSVAFGAGIGLVVGKALGVAGATFLVVRLGLAPLPGGVRPLQVVGVAVLAGIGFTVSLFVTELAYTGPHDALARPAKVGILAASVVAAAVGSAVLWWAARPSRGGSVGVPVGGDSGEAAAR